MLVADYVQANVTGRWFAWLTDSVRGWIYMTPARLTLEDAINDVINSADGEPVETGDVRGYPFGPVNT